MQSKKWTEPKLSPAKPTDTDRDWYVWFRWYDGNKWVQLRFKKGINRFKSFRERLAEANALKQATKEDLIRGWNPLQIEKVIRIYSIEEALNYILKVKVITLKKKTKYAYSYITGNLLQWLKSNGQLSISTKSFTPKMAQDYMDNLLIKKNYSGRTFNDHLIVLRTFFNCFIDREWIIKNPFRSVKKKTQTIGRNLAYTDAEKQYLEKELYEKDRRLFYFTQIMFHCFIRRTELISLKVKHIDLINKTIIIPGENAKNMIQESVVIPEGLEGILKEMELDKFNSEDFVFGRKLETCSVQYKNPNWITSRHKEFVKSIDKGLYSWKHTGCCNYYYATGKDIYSLMRQLRHRDLSTTMIYLKSLGLVNNEIFRLAKIA